MREFDLSTVEISVVLFLADHPQYDTSRDIAEHLMLAKSNVSTVVERLVQRRFLSRQPDRADRRRVHLKLMAPAWHLAKQGEIARRQMLDQVLAGFSPDEIQEMRQIEQRIRKNIHAMLKNK